jgi:hypothetical protein
VIHPRPSSSSEPAGLVTRWAKAASAGFLTGGLPRGAEVEHRAERVDVRAGAAGDHGSARGDFRLRRSKDGEEADARAHARSQKGTEPVAKAMRTTRVVSVSVPAFARRTWFILRLAVHELRLGGGSGEGPDDPADDRIYSLMCATDHCVRSERRGAGSEAVNAKVPTDKCEKRRVNT